MAPAEPQSGDEWPARGDGTVDGDGTRPQRRPFRVQVAALRKQNGTTRSEHRSGPIPGLGAVAVVVPDEALVACDLVLASYPGGIMVTGDVRAPWVGECRRCGGPVAGTVSASVRERFAANGSKDGDEEAYPLEGDELDLEPLARDAVLLGLPLAPLCQESCRGLCPTCGVNRNLDVCQCESPRDPRWAALDGLGDGTPAT